MAAKKNEQHPLRIEGYGSAGEGVACDTDMLPASERFFISAAASSV